MQNESDLKTGTEILDDFFNNLKKLGEIDPEVVRIIEALYNSDDLTSTKLFNKLDELRNTDENEN